MLFSIENDMCVSKHVYRIKEGFKNYQEYEIVMSYAEVLYTVPEELGGHFREYERIGKKLINLNWSIEFNSICKKEISCLIIQDYVIMTRQ